MILFLRHFMLPAIVLAATLIFSGLFFYFNIGGPYRVWIYKGSRFSGHGWGQEPDENVIRKCRYLSVIVCLLGLSLAVVGVFPRLYFGELYFPRDIYSNGNVNDIKEAIKSGAEINDWDDNGWTPLMFAAINNRNLKSIDFLIDEGANVNEGPRGRTPLLAVIDSSGKNTQEKIETIRLLVKRGASPYYFITENQEQLTALMLAAKKKETELVKLLLEMGVNPKIENIHKKTALDYADRNREEYGILARCFKQ